MAATYIPPAAAETDPGLPAAVASLTAAIAAKQDLSVAATDAEVAAVNAALSSAIADVQASVDAVEATGATDAEVASAVAALAAAHDARLDAVESGDLTFSGAKAFSGGLNIVDRFGHDAMAGAAGTPLNGRVMPTGQTIAVTGPQAAGMVLDGNGRAVNAAGNGYATVQYSATPRRIGGIASVVAGAGGGTAGMALILARTATFLDDMVHVNFSRTGGRVSLWTSAQTTPAAWAAATAYVKDQVVLESGNRYAATRNITSGATFDATEQRRWQLLGANVASDSPMASGEPSAGITFVTPIPNGAPFSVYMSIVGTQVHVEFWSEDGLTFHGAISCSDPRVPALVGGFATYQITGPGDAAATHSYRWEEIAAIRDQEITSEQAFDAPAGLTGPIGAKRLAAGYFSRVGVGLNDPRYPLDVIYTSGTVAPTARFRSTATRAVVEIHGDGPGLGARLMFKPNTGTDANSPRIDASTSFDLDFITNDVSRMQLPFAGGISLKDTITLTDAKNIVVGSTTGTKIGTATTQKLGFFNATPIVQPARPTDAASIITAGTALGLWA